MSPVTVGNRYGKLIVLALIKDRKNPLARCLCDCGVETIRQRGGLANGRAKSCGCLKRESASRQSRTHGMSKSRTYRIWHGINGRCSNPKLKEWPNYGGRGIRVKWNTFEEFFSDMGKCPEMHWIDRIDNNGHYEKSNCKWVMPKINQKNKRTSKFWIIDGVIYESSVEAASVFGVTPSVIIRGCNGYERNGKKYKPRAGWHCAFKYTNHL